jgi:putative colanic acid biosynthesis acetyltransferase WcaF
LANKLARVLWGIVYLLAFRWTPRPLHAWRNLILRMFGADLHPTARVYPTARIWHPGRLKMGAHACIANDVDVYNVGGVELGAHALVSQYSYLCGATHDHEDVDFPLLPKPIVIHARAWVAADVYVAPGVTIGEGTVVGARSSVFADLPAWQVCVGTPAKPVKARVLGPDDY